MTDALRELRIHWQHFLVIWFDLKMQRYALKRDNAAEKMRTLINARSPEQVAKMERDRGLA